MEKNKSNTLRLKDLEKVYRFQCPKCGEWDYAFLDNDDPEAGNEISCLYCHCWITIEE